VHPVTAAGVLAGRADELALLDGLLRDLTRGSGNAVLIEGEPGIGKTALVHAALSSTTRASSAGAHHGSQWGYQVFWGAGDELGQELPLHPFLDALRVRAASANARRTAIAGLLRGEVATDRGADVPALLAEQLIALTVDETAARPVVLVIDDLHWADPASVKLWGRLARTAGQVPLLLVGITRPVAQREDLLVLRRAVDDAKRVSLASLSQPAVAELVGALAGGRPDTGLLELAAGAAGNPLYLTELLAALARSAGITVDRAGNARLAAGTVPDSLPEVIADRLGFVCASTREVLRAAALLGLEFAITDLTTVLGRTVTDLVPALDEARSTGVLTDSINGLAFRHPLIREALYAELPTSIRAAWHRDAGHALAAAGVPPERVARQLLRGPADDGPDWILDWLAKSADSLVGQAPGVAAELLARAVDSIPAGSATHGWLADRLADALYRTGDQAAAERVAERALGHAADPDLIVDLHWTMTQCRMRSGSADESFAALDRALDIAGLSAKHRARLLVLGARTYLNLGEVDAAGRRADAALASAVDASDTWATGWALNVLAIMATVQGKLADALPLYDQALAVTETDPALTDLGLLLLVNKAVTLCNLNRYDEALATAERARQLADQVGTAIRLAQAHGVLGQLFFETGRWDDALAELEAVPTDLKEPGAACGELGILAVISFRRNEPAAAREHLAATEALAVLTAAFDGNPDDLGETEDLLMDAVRLALKTGDKWTAQTLAGQAAALAEGSRVPHRQANALYCQGLIDRDATVLLEAAQRLEDAGRPLPRARALEAAAECLVEIEQRTPARLAFEQAVAVYEFLGAEADLNRVNAEFRLHGIRRGPHSKHRRATSGWESLTDTELKVAALVVEGLSNPEIAARLVLSRRTVTTHVSHILKKLDVATRTEIARESALRARSA
jgi:DNA-binding CsgD family transcriptional regulator/tetratricopeptide (TPR) repeat protein